MRNRYLDLLRAAAIVRVIVYHLFGWPWLSILLPAMGIMFALAGSLTAASLDKRSAGQMITSRLRRLLPPLWLLAVIVVPTMLYLGWAQENTGDKPLSWKLILWILPIGEPPGSQRGIDVWEPLWYVRAYLWFVLLSPLLYRAYKRIGWAAVAAPIVLIAVLDKTGLALPWGRADAAMWDFATYGACWIAGFAHHDGRLARIRPGRVVAISAVLGLAALYWLRGHAGQDGYDLNDVSESQALWSLAFVLPALRWQPSMSWLERSPRLDGIVTLLNARAVTIYLWHNIAIAAIWPVLTVLALDDMGDLDGPTDLIASLALTMAAVLAFGWVEDLAAGRRPRLWPTGGGSDRSASPELGGDGAVAVRTRSGGPGPVAGSRPGALADGSPSGGADWRTLVDGGTGRRDSDPDDAWRPDVGIGAGADVALGANVALGAGAGGGDSRSDGGSHGPGETRSAGLTGGAPHGGRDAAPAGARWVDTRQTPWGPAGMVPVVAGASGVGAPQREGAAPFPDAKVPFGLPDAGAGIGARTDGSPEVAGPAAPLVGGTDPAAPVAPESAQARGLDVDDRAPAGWWFKREGDDRP